MKTLHTFFILVGCTGLIATGCVSKKKYNESLVRNEALRSDSISTHVKVQACTGSLDECATTLIDTKNKVAQLTDKNATGAKNYKELSANSQMTIADQAKRLTDLQHIVQVQKDVMNKLRNTISDALVGFTPEELSIEFKNGNIYVSLQEKLLFKSGSDKVDLKGQEALQKLAFVLNTYSDININIEGHTDNVPIKGVFADNWALSVARATSIVRILTTANGVDPKTIIASGRSEYFPVESNLEATGRARNRRTEIILSPNLTELFKLLNQ
jgi:chemotaxis protein MotB